MSTASPPHPEITLVSADAVLAETIADRLREWGLTTRLIEDVTLLESESGHAIPPGVVILDIRRDSAPSLRWLRETRSQAPPLEVVLVNNPDRMTTSLEGMRAGAAAELTMPIDLGEMRRVLMTALSKTNGRRSSRSGNNFSRFFRQTMAAITYAQAGEFETARDFLDNPKEPPEQGVPPRNKR
ncbi:MAG: hypothetical protein HGA96_12200 [Desulfobulbaceae bacterium]|nr:hypothetical protein [Desulfobulbaceae bacterium]